MKYLFDSNVCIHLFRQSNANVARHVAARSSRELCVCDIVVAELRFGASKSRDPFGNHRLIDDLLTEFASLPFNTSCAAHFGELKADLERRGQRIGEFDMLIAATALANSLTLVTHNTAEFSRIPGLLLEDWELP